MESFSISDLKDLAHQVDCILGEELEIHHFQHPAVKKAGDEVKLMKLETLSHKSNTKKKQEQNNNQETTLANSKRSLKDHAKKIKCFFQLVTLPPPHSSPTPKNPSVAQ